MVQLQEFPAPTEGVRFQNSSVVALIDDADLGNGTLYITESALTWRSSASGEGFTVQYPRMCLHAISHDSNVHPMGCLYIMVNGKVCSDNLASEEDEIDDDDMDPEDEICEIKFVPAESDLLQGIYNVVHECSILHPDPSSDMSEEEGGEEDFGGAGDFENDYDSENEGNGRTPGLDGAGDNGDYVYPNQFADAEDDDD